MSINQINVESFVPIEQHFKVSAGPGAGKTRWLVNHIKNILHQSKRLGKTRKIVCITYTNVAAEIILERLGLTIENIEVSTIHSFLYKHVVQPYAIFIPKDYSLNINKLDGHEDFVFTSFKFLEELKAKTQQKYIQDDGRLIKAIKAAKWKFDNDENLIIKPDYPHKVGRYSIKNKTYFEYKKMSWEKGVVHHDDILFFGHELITKFPFILQVLRAKFPYFFIDEFQDTNPIQTKILTQIGQEETVVGIIGDKAQSIYGFQGANPSQLSLFTLEGMVEYQIMENYRSTDKIIDFLNCIRHDLKQSNPGHNGNGENVRLIVGEMGTSLHKAQELCHGERICSLSRDNITSNVLKKEVGLDCPSEDLLQGLLNADSDNERKSVISSCIKALELSADKRYRDSIREISKFLKIENDKTAHKKEALRCLNLMLARYAEIQEMSLMEFHAFLKSNVKDSLAKPSRGRPKEFYDKYKYKELAVCVNIKEDNSLNRTIHKAKGDEFDNVILVLKKASDLAFVLNPDLEGDEEHRINYVAVSRARKKLFISVPSLLELSDADRCRLSVLLDIIE